jgi:hypothetical protein
MLATPAMARESGHVTKRVAVEANAAAADTSFYSGDRACVPAPRVGAFATAPWSDTNVPCEPGTGAF